MTARVWIILLIGVLLICGAAYVGRTIYDKAEQPKCPGCVIQVPFENPNGK